MAGPRFDNPAVLSVDSASLPGLRERLAGLAGSPRYYVEAEYQCARNISGREDNFCNTYSDKADGYDSEIVTEGVGRSDHVFDWWHHFGTARSVTKYQLLRLMVKWRDQNVVSRGSDGDYGTKLRMYDVRRDSSGWSKLANTSGPGS